MLAQLFLAAPSRETVLLVFTAGWLVATAFWLWTVRDCLVSGRVEGREKLVWALVLLGTYALGAVAYFVLVQIRRPLPPKT